MKISVILPAYRECKNLTLLVPQISLALSAYEHEIVVVDDNSQDGTAESMKSLIDNGIQIQMITRTEDRGFAKSIRCGIENASGDIVIVMDSDFNHQPDYLPFMIDNLKYYDCITASRFQYGGMMSSRSRHLLSWIFNIFVRIMTGGMITDSLYGFFAIHKNKLSDVNFDKVFWGYGDYCIRLMYYLQSSNLKILQFPAVNGERVHGTGNSNLIKVFIQYFSEVVKLTYRIRIKHDI